VTSERSADRACAPRSFQGADHRLPTGAHLTDDDRLDLRLVEAIRGPAGSDIDVARTTLEARDPSFERTRMAVLMDAGA
jgi:hypothetical protein